MSIFRLFTLSKLLNLIIFLVFFSFSLIWGFNSKSEIKKVQTKVLGVNEVHSFLPYNWKENSLLLQIPINENYQMQLNFPSKINENIVTRDSKNFYLECKNSTTQIRPELTLPSNFNLSSENIGNIDFQKNINFIQTKLNDAQNPNCIFNENQIAEIKSGIEIRQNPKNLFNINSVKAALKLENQDYILTGNCFESGQLETINQVNTPCSLWSKPKNSIYPDLVTDKLRTWYPTGDITFYTDNNFKPGDTGYTLANLNPANREATLFYVKNQTFKVVNFILVNNGNEFRQKNTQKTLIVNQESIQNLFYRQNKLPFVILNPSQFEKPNINIKCFWENNTESNFWESEKQPNLPLSREISCKIGEMIAKEGKVGMKITAEELKSGEGWFANKSAFEAVNLISSELKLQNPGEICNLEDKKLPFESKICPLGVYNFSQLNSDSFLTTSKKIGIWNIQNVVQNNSNYRIYTYFNESNLWVYWYKLDNENLTLKQFELDLIMKRISISSNK